MAPATPAAGTAVPPAHATARPAAVDGQQAQAPSSAPGKRKLEAITQESSGTSEPRVTPSAGAGVPDQAQAPPPADKRPRTDAPSAADAGTKGKSTSPESSGGSGSESSSSSESESESESSSSESSSSEESGSESESESSESGDESSSSGSSSGSESGSESSSSYTSGEESGSSTGGNDGATLPHVNINQPAVIVTAQLPPATARPPPTTPRPPSMAARPLLAESTPRPATGSTLHTPPKPQAAMGSPRPVQVGSRVLTGSPRPMPPRPPTTAGSPRPVPTRPPLAAGSPRPAPPRPPTTAGSPRPAPPRPPTTAGSPRPPPTRPPIAAGSPRPMAPRPPLATGAPRPMPTTQQITVGRPRPTPPSSQAAIGSPRPVAVGPQPTADSPNLAAAAQNMAGRPLDMPVRPHVAISDAQQAASGALQPNAVASQPPAVGPPPIKDSSLPVESTAQQKPSKKKRKEKKSHHPSPDTPQPTGLPHSPRRTPSRAKHAEKTKPDNVQPEESSSSEGEQAAQYNLRQRTKPVSYRLAPQPKSPPDRYKKYLRDLREMERKADEMSALSDIEETIAPVRPAGSDDEAEHTGRAAGGDELEPILPMNMAELGVERCRRAGYSGPVGSTGSGPTRSAVSFEDVGGLDEYIRSLKEMVVLPLVYPEIYGSFGIRPPRGVLFHGPPGTGKTLLARALSQSCQAQDGGQTIAFFMRRGADCLSKWVGDAERQLRVLFEQARAFQPSIIFFDELDGLAPARSARQDQVHTSVVATLLALMDGVDDRGQVVVIGATNRPDAIDSALRRPGRFDREMRFRLPGPEARRRILHIHSRGWLNHMQPADEEVVVARTQGWGGADIGALCTEAVLAAVRRSYPQIYESREKLPIDPRRIVVSGIDIREALALVAPSTGRSGASSTAALAPELRPLLGPHEERAARQLVSALRLGTEKLSSLCMQYLGTAVFRPRVAIYGLAGMGVPSVAAAVAHTMEARDVPVFVVGAQHMHSGGDASAGSHVVRLFSEARRRQPSVVYIPGVGQLAEAMGGSAATLLSQCIQELAPGDRVGVVIAAEAPLAAAAPTGDWVDGREGAPPTTHAERMWRAAVPPFARQWFAGTPSACRICVGVPTSTQRKAFFAPVIDLADAAAQLSATGGDPASDAAQLPLPALTSPAQCPVPDPPVFELPPPPMSQPAGNLASGDETTEQRRLKHKLAEVTKTLRANRLFSAFAAPPRPSKHRGYYTAVTRPMFLNMMALKVGACQYKSVEEYMADIRLIGRNAVAYAKRCDVLAAKGGSAGTGSDGGDEDEDEETTDVADAITREVEAAKRANVFVVAAAKLCDHHVRPLSRTPSEASMPATPTRGPTPIPTPTLEPMPTPTSAQMPTMLMSTTPDLAAGDAASQRARWSVGTGFNNLSTPSQRAKKHSSKPRRMTGGIPQVVHEVVAPIGSAGGNVRADDGHTLFLRDLLRLTRGFSADALEALRVRLATELSACTVAGAHQQLPAPPVFRPLAAVLRLWHDDAVRDRCDLGGPSALGDSEMSSDDY